MPKDEVSFREQENMMLEFLNQDSKDLEKHAALVLEIAEDNHNNFLQ